ncbi:MAG TPA: GLPGLI family protein [Flavitalea sp.]|nr:GLPGLI family protein [Flavitalea sp.]
MYRHYFFPVFAILISISIRGQAVFVSSGTITYERKINLHRQEVRWEGLKDIIAKQPVFNNANFELSFSPGKTLYQPAEKFPEFEFGWLLGPAKENIVKTDFVTGRSQSTKDIFGDVFLIEDSVSNLQWRVSSEKREIAGFSCRKAVTRIADSVYITAFYTDEIPVSGGPESFHGLPGMILGLAVPRLYTTWFATKVSLEPSKLPEPKFSARQKKITYEDLSKQLVRLFERWEENAQKYIWWTYL